MYSNGIKIDFFKADCIILPRELPVCNEKGAVKCGRFWQREFGELLKEQV
jgi:hypothetical protein